MAKSFSMATILPLMTAPSWGDWVTKLCSSMAAKSSRLGEAMEFSVLILVWVAARAIQILQSYGHAEWRSPLDFPCGRMGGRLLEEVSGWLESRRASLAPVAVLERAFDPGGNQGKGCRERRVYTQIGGIEQGGVRGLFQGRNRPGFVGGVPGVEFRQQVPPRPARSPCPSVPASGDGRAVPAGRRYRVWRWRPGQITVPMSRPSITAPGLPPGGDRRKLRWKSSRACRTAGMAATWEAACPTTSVRMAGSPARERSMDCAPAHGIGLVSGIALGVQHRQRGQAIERAGIQMRETEMRRQSSWPRCPCPTRRCRPRR